MIFFSVISNNNNLQCVICKDDESNKSLVTVGNKGLKTLVGSSKVRENGDLEMELNERTTVKVHATCKSDFTNERKSSLSVESPK